jgi:hypothetical protein
MQGRGLGSYKVHEPYFDTVVIPTLTSTGHIKDADA